MANRNVTPVRAGIEGAAPTDLAATLSASDNYMVRNDGTVMLVVEKRNQTGDTVITLVTQKQEQGLDIADRAVTLTGVTSGTRRVVIRDIPPDLYNTPEGRVDVSFDDVSGISAFVVAS